MNLTMRIIQTVKKILVVASLGLAPAVFAEKIVEDMLLVNFQGKYFYIDVFESSNSRVLKALSGTDSQDWKPARMDYERANQYCAAVGKRLPTMEEWIWVGSNEGQNKKYTLIGDKLKDESGELLANVARKYGESMSPLSYERVGIDAFGTVGMTGNRAEWVTTLEGKPAQCGGEYETEDTELLKIPNLCSATRLAKSATARCVLDYSSDIKIQLTSNVGGSLKAYLDKRALNPGGIIEILFLPRTRYTKMKPGDARRLDKGDPSFVEDYERAIEQEEAKRAASKSQPK